MCFLLCLLKLRICGNKMSCERSLTLNPFKSILYLLPEVKGIQLTFKLSLSAIVLCVLLWILLGKGPNLIYFTIIPYKNNVDLVASSSILSEKLPLLAVSSTPNSIQQFHLCGWSPLRFICCLSWIMIIWLVTI